MIYITARKETLNSLLIEILTIIFAEIKLIL